MPVKLHAQRGAQTYLHIYIKYCWQLQTWKW